MQNAFFAEMPVQTETRASLCSFLVFTWALPAAAGMEQISVDLFKQKMYPVYYRLPGKNVF